MPSSWGRLELSLRPLTFLRLQDLEIHIRGKINGSLRLRDACVLREAAWYRTCLRWFVEGAFPICLRGIEIRLTTESLLSLVTPSAPKTPKSTRARRRRGLRLPRWMWRWIFKTLKRLVITVADISIMIEVRSTVPLECLRIDVGYGRGCVLGACGCGI